MSNQIRFQVLGDVKDLEKKMSEGKKAFDGLGKASAIAFAGMTASAFGFIEAARQQELAINGLNQALKNQGNYTESASQELVKYASALQEASLFGDETIVQAQAMIASFGIEGQQLKELTRATLDLAQAKGMDLVSAADLVGKSVGSTTNAMARYGIAIDGAAGSATRIQHALDGINRLYGGQAEAATKGLGATVQLKNAIGDLGEEIGMALAPSVIEITKSITGLVNEMKEHPEVSKMAAEFLKFGIVATGVTASIWGINSAAVALTGTVKGLIPLMTAVAPLAVAAFAGYKITEAANETWGLVRAHVELNKELKDQARVEAESLAARGLTKDQVMSDGAMRIEIIKSVSAAEVAAAEQKIATERRVQEDLEMLKTEMQAIAATRTQQELDELLLKYQYQRDAEIEYMNMQQELLDANQALTLEKEEQFRQQRAEINARYDGIEQVGRQQMQEKMSAIDQKGSDIAKKVNQDKVASLSSTLQQAAQLNSKFANAYKAVAIGEAIMNTASGVARAFKDYPFPASLGVAALVGAAGAVQIATIAQQQFAVGTPEIPRDMTATVHQGEMIIPATFSDAIRSGDLSLSGGASTGGSSSGVSFNFSGAVFNGVTEGFVREIFEKASESIQNKTLIFRSV